MKRTVVGSLLLAGFLGGCYPKPKGPEDLAIVQGHLHVEGLPPEGVLLQLELNCCRQVAYETTTNQWGEYRFPEVDPDRYRLLVVPPGCPPVPIAFPRLPLRSVLDVDVAVEGCVVRPLTPPVTRIRE